MSISSSNWLRWCGVVLVSFTGLGPLLGACSSDDPPPGSAGSAGEGNGGQPGVEPSEGGSSGDPLFPTDREPPVFEGLREATVEGETRVRLSWEPASDDASPSERIAYAVYAAQQAGGQDFGAPLAIAPAGAEGILISGLTPSTEYFFVVRALDQAGNEDDNSEEASAATEDQSPPSFAGITKLTAATSRTLLLEWKPARDKGAPPDEIRYNVYIAEERGKQNFAKPTVTTAPGQTSILVPRQQPLTEYFAVVRAVDADDNEDDNDYQLSVRTPEGVNPTFDGAKRALAEPGGVRLYWSPASDNVTELANIVYDIFVSTESAKYDFSKPAYTSPPAAVSFFVDGLTAGQRYYFVVRARDVGGNTDNNTVEVNARPLGAVDKSAPAFSGVTTATGTSPSTLVATWAPASDDVTPSSAIVYEVYVSDTSGAHNFNTPRFVTPPGATSVTMTGLPPGAARYFVVHARDQAGNVAVNRKEARGATLASPDSDGTPPVFGTGPTLATVDSFPYRMVVSWTAATDNAHPAADIRYHVCAEPQEANCVGVAFTDHIRATSDWGATTLTLNGLESRTTYFVYVRAEDKSGNLEFGSHGASRTTLTSWVTDVEPILNDKCLSCHSFSVLNLVGVPGGFVDPKYGTLSLVEPGLPERSLLYRRLNPLGLKVTPFSALTPNDYSGPQEPRDGSNQYVLPLSGAEDGAIRDWITQGAFGTE